MAPGTTSGGGACGSPSSGQRLKAGSRDHQWRFKGSQYQGDCAHVFCATRRDAICFSKNFAAETRKKRIWQIGLTSLRHAVNHSRRHRGCPCCATLTVSTFVCRRTTGNRLLRCERSSPIAPHSRKHRTANEEDVDCNQRGALTIDVCSNHATPPTRGQEGACRPTACPIRERRCRADKEVAARPRT